MGRDQKPSRRDWFRLMWKDSENGPDPQSEEQKDQPPSQKPVLNPVSQPVNHGGFDLSELPPMRQADLTEDQVADLFSDVASCAKDVRLMMRSKNSVAADLQSAKKAILSGSVSRLQIRYRWEGKYWIDTLQVVPGGIQLIRIAHPGSPV